MVDEELRVRRARKQWAARRPPAVRARLAAERAHSEARARARQMVLHGGVPLLRATVDAVLAYLNAGVPESSIKVMLERQRRPE